jgi:hypothetical protein
MFSIAMHGVNDFAANVAFSVAGKLTRAESVPPLEVEQPDDSDP